MRRRAQQGDAVLEGVEEMLGLPSSSIHAQRHLTTLQCRGCFSDGSPERRARSRARWLAAFPHRHVRRPSRGCHEARGGLCTTWDSSALPWEGPFCGFTPLSWVRVPGPWAWTVPWAQHP